MAFQTPPRRSVPTQFLNAKEFKVDRRDTAIFPLDFLPDGTTIGVKPGDVEGEYELSWTNGGEEPRAIEGLTWDQQNPLGGLTGKNLTIIIGNLELVHANVSIAPTASLNDGYWNGKICIEEPYRSGTSTTGTFIAQASTDGDG